MTKPTEQETKPARRRAAAPASQVNPKTSKKQRLGALLARPKGATLTDLEKNLGWQPHTVRAAISGLRKTGIDIVLDRNGKVPVYRVVGPPSAAAS